MKETYITPQVEAVTFAPSKAIATERPGWGWEEDVFSASEPKGINEGGDGYEG